MPPRSGAVAQASRILAPETVPACKAVFSSAAAKKDPVQEIRRFMLFRCPAVEVGAQELVGCLCTDAW